MEFAMFHLCRLPSVRFLMPILQPNKTYMIYFLFCKLQSSVQSHRDHKPEVNVVINPTGSSGRLQMRVCRPAHPAGLHILRITLRLF